MNPSILLLDCSTQLEERLKRQGFDVASGSVGSPNRKVYLPGPVYEYEVIIYNPMSATVQDNTRGGADTLLTSLETVSNSVKYAERRIPYHDEIVFEFGPLVDHIRRGAIVLLFINPVSEIPIRLNTAYSWVPNMPEIAATQDFKPLSSLSLVELYEIKEDKKSHVKNITELAPVLTTDNLKRPVRQKIILNDAFREAVPLYLNRQLDYLGLSLKIGSGQIIALPEYDDNDCVIGTFLNRVFPRLRTGPTRHDIVDTFVSPLEQSAKQEIQHVESERQALDERLEKAKEQLALGERSKRKTIESDETASRIISYYNTATQQEDVALFFLYKIIDALQNKFGGAIAAKQKLGIDDDRKLIGTIANASYSDVRHAPKPGEIIKPWTKEEIEDCFAAAERILAAYFSTLFEQS